MRKQHVFVWLFFLTTLLTKAQVLDSIRSSLKQKAKFDFHFDSRSSFISAFPARIFGFKIGAEFGKRIRIGGGFNVLNSIIGYKKPIYNITTQQYDTAFSNLNFAYISYYIEYIFYKSKHWEFSIPFQLGIGSSNYTYYYNGFQFIENQRTVLIYEPSIAGSYKITKWFGIGGEFGYRFMIKNNNLIPQQFNSFIYSLGIEIYLTQIYKSLFYNTKLAQKID